MKVDCQKSTIDAIQHEVENTRSHLEHEHTLKQQRLEEVYSKKVHDATSLNKDLKSEIERLEVQVKNNREKVQKQEEVIEKLNEELKSSTCGGNTTFFQHELKDLEQMVAQGWFCLHLLVSSSLVPRLSPQKGERLGTRLGFLCVCLESVDASFNASFIPRPS